MDKNLVNVAIATTTLAVAGLGAIESQAVRDEPRFAFNVHNALSEREYHQQRIAYLEQYGEQEGVPEYVLPSARVVLDNLESYLLEKKFTNRKGGPIQEPPRGIIGPAAEQLSVITEPLRAYAALDFGHEGLEGGSTPASFDSFGDVFGDTSITLDSGSNMTGTYSMYLQSPGPGSGSSIAYHDHTSTMTDVYMSFTVKLTSGFSFGASNYTGLFQWRDTSNNIRVRINIENYGSPRLIVSGDPGYTNTSINLTPGTQEKIELHIIKNTSTGVVEVWIDNDTEGSPDYDSGNIDSGASTVQRATWGLTFAPEGHSDIYLDDFCYGDAFIGATCVAAAEGRRAILRVTPQ